MFNDWPGSFRGNAQRVYSTSFPATENPISEGSKWTNGAVAGTDWANARTTPGFCFGTQTGNGNDGANTAPNKYDDTTAILAGTWGPNQYAEATVVNNEISGSWNSEVEIRLRTTITAHVNSGYECNIRVKASATAYCEIIRWEGAIGIYTSLVHTDNAAFALATGDTIAARIEGDLIQVYRNHVVIASVRDTTWLTGAPGMGFYLNNQGATGDTSRYGFSSFWAVTD